MGQANSPFLLKLGRSMFWQTMWSDKISYSRKLNEDIFLNMFLPLFFKKNFFKKVHLETFYGEYSHKKSKRKLQSQFMFVGKTWFLRYNNWCVLVFFVYDAIKLTRQKKKKTLLPKAIYKTLFTNSNTLNKLNPKMINYNIF